MEHWLATLGQIPAVAVYAFVLIWLAAESTGLPLPNELVLILAGSLAAQGHVSAPILVVVAVLGSLIGASCAYWIGARGGRAAVMRFGRYIRLDEKRLDQIEAQFARSGWVAIAISRITPFVRTVASFPAGMLLMPRRAFLLATFGGSLVWCTVMVTLGDLLGTHYLTAVHLIEHYTIPAILVLAALVAGYYWLHSRLKRGGRHTPSTAELEAARKRERR